MREQLVNKSCLMRRKNQVEQTILRRKINWKTEKKKEVPGGSVRKGVYKTLQKLKARDKSWKISISHLISLIESTGHGLIDRSLNITRHALTLRCPHALSPKGPLFGINKF